MKYASQGILASSVAHGLNRSLLAICMAVGLSAFSAAQTVTKVTVAPASVTGGMPSTGTVSITPKAGADGVMVSLSVQSDFATVPQSVSIAKGKSSATFAIKTSATPSDMSVPITASLSDSHASANLTIKGPAFDSFTLTPVKVTGGTSLTGTVKIKSAAPATGLSIIVTSNSQSAIAPESFQIPGGSKVGTFSVTTTPVSSATIAKISVTLGNSSAVIPVTINPPTLTTFAFTPSTIASGGSATGKITLSGPAPSGLFGCPISATSSQDLILPTFVSINQGESSATFTVSSRPTVTKKTIVVTAKLGVKTLTASLVLTAAPKNPFMGSYVGSFLQPDGSIGGATIGIAADGTLSGKVTGSSVKTVSGSIDKNGDTNLTVSNTSGINTASGMFAYTPKGLLFGTLTTDQNSTVWITLNYVNKPLMFAGSYSGTFSNADSSGLVTISVSASGAITGTATPQSGGSSTLKGSVNSTGVVSLSATSNGKTDKNSGFGAFDSEGQLIVIVTSADGQSTTTVTLQKM